MNSLQLSQRLARNLSVTDPFDLDADVALDVLSAINAGLNSFYRNAPGIYRRTTLSHTVRAPRAVSVVFLEQYSRLVGNDTFEARDQGCTVRFGDGSADNIVTGPNSLLDNYLGETLSLDATLYADAVPVQDVIERIIGHVRLYDRARTSPTPLTRHEGLRGGLGQRRRIGDRDDLENINTIDGITAGAIGRPRYYYLDPMGASQGAEPEFLLRLAPLPDLDYTIRMEAELSTQRIIFSDLTVAREIVVGSSYIDDILIPLCEAELVTSSFWRDKTQVQLIQTKAEKALAKMGAIPSDVGPSSNLVGTPAGF